jgi:N-acetylglucosaminyldiphosphoundecaprenol N-acetyl-beta-D-mannosaminyltransferase
MAKGTTLPASGRTSPAGQVRKGARLAEAGNSAGDKGVEPRNDALTLPSTAKAKTADRLHDARPQRPGSHVDDGREGELGAVTSVALSDSGLDGVEAVVAPEPEDGRQVNGKEHHTLAELTPVRLPLSQRLDPARLPGPPSLPTVRLAGVELHAVTEEQAVETVLAELECGRGGVVVTPNLDHLYRCTKNMTFAALVAEADLVVADGTPLVWASRVKGTPLPERVAGSNLISSLSCAAAAAGRRVYLLGGDPGTADGAARVLQQRYPDLTIAGTHCPPLGFEYDSAQMAKLVEKLQEARPDIVFVALGSPKQEKLINQIRRTLPRAWWLGVGISFSFLTGQVRRAPQWMQRAGMEWLHRLAQEPRRLFRRYVVVGVPFAAKLMSRSLGERVSRGLGLARPEPVKRHAGTLRLADALDEQARINGDVNALAVERKALGKRRNGHARHEIEGRDDIAELATQSEARQADTATVLSRLRALVLLGGKVRPSGFARGCGRPVLELPVTDQERLMDHWLRQAEEVARLAGVPSLPVRVVVSDEQDSPLPQGASGGRERAADAFTVERDLSEYRGTGGVLHDFAREFADEDMLLVCNAAQILMEPLTVIARALAHKGADVALVAHDDGTPSGAMLVSVKTLRQISPVGYVDMKEQALPRIAREFTVRAVRCRRPSGMPMRSLETYIRALQQQHAKSAQRGRGAEPDPLAENFTRHFSIIEPGAEVHPTAYAHDSVVLAGARVEAGATLVRCVVCEGAVVPRDARMVDTLVTRTALRPR